MLARLQERAKLEEAKTQMTKDSALMEDLALEPNRIHVHVHQIVAR